ncbi:MAG: response regulator transcription factor [Planctomycetaceae bacterium]
MSEQRQTNHVDEFLKLSAREVEVLEHLVQGLSNKQIAAVLFLSPRTVEKHRASIHRKMGTHSLAVLTRMWLDHSSAIEPAAA